MNPSTLAQLKTNVFAKFPKTNMQVQGIFDRQIQTWCYELAKEFPWYCLREYPLDIAAIDFPLTLSTETPVFGDWLAPGWLIVQPGVSQYQLAYPLEFDQWENPSWWRNVTSDRIHYAKLFDGQGYFRKDLPVCSRDQALSYKRYIEGHRPEYFYLSSTESGSFINLLPVPDDYYLFAVEFQNSNPLFYVNSEDSQTYNKMMTFYPRALELYALIQVAEYFDEPGKTERWEKELFGTAGGGNGLMGAVLGRKGLIGSMVRDSEKSIKQKTQVMSFYKSARQAVGRDGNPRRRRFENRWGYR